MNFKIFIFTILLVDCRSNETKLLSGFYESHFYPRPQAKPFGYNPSLFINHIKNHNIKKSNRASNQISNQNIIINSGNSKILNQNYIFNQKPVQHISSYILNSNLIKNSRGSQILNQNKNTMDSRRTQIRRIPLNKIIQ